MSELEEWGGRREVKGVGGWISQRGRREPCRSSGRQPVIDTSSDWDGVSGKAGTLNDWRKVMKVEPAPRLVRIHH